MRSWADGTVALTPGAHIFWGENGAGKTTILEACIIAATGRSHRAGALREVIIYELAGAALKGLAWGAGAVALKELVGALALCVGDQLAREVCALYGLCEEGGS